MATATHSYSMADVVRGYHVYQRIWTPTVGGVIRHSTTNLPYLIASNTESLEKNFGHSWTLTAGRPGPLLNFFAGAGCTLGFREIGSGASFGSLVK